MKLTPTHAAALAAQFDFPLDRDFFTLPVLTVVRVLEAADFVKYRKPKNANGSRGRYFYAYLQRAAARVDKTAAKLEADCVNVSKR